MAKGATVNACSVDRPEICGGGIRPQPIPPTLPAVRPTDPTDDFYLYTDTINPDASQLWNELAGLFEAYNHDWNLLKKMFLKWFNLRYKDASTTQRSVFHVWAPNDDGLLSVKPLHLLVSLMLQQNGIREPGFDTTFDYNSYLHSGAAPINYPGQKDYATTPDVSRLEFGAGGTQTNASSVLASGLSAMTAARASVALRYSGPPVSMASTGNALVIQSSSSLLMVYGNAFNIGLQEGMAFANLNNLGPLKSVALTPNGNGSVMLFGTNAAYETGAPSSLWTELLRIHDQGSEIKQVLFDPDDATGNRWCILFDDNDYSQSGMESFGKTWVNQSKNIYTSFVTTLDGIRSRNRRIISAVTGKGGKFIVNEDDGFSYHYNKIATKTLTQIQAAWKAGLYPAMFTFDEDGGGAMIRYEKRRVEPTFFIPSFNSDRRADIVVQHKTTHAIRVVIQDTQATCWEQNLPVTDPSFAVVSMGHVDGDSYPDLILQDPATGAIGWRRMQRVNPDGGVRLFADQWNDPNWRLVASTDVNGDGHSDLIWQHHFTRALKFWLMQRWIKQSELVPAVQPSSEQTLVAARSFDKDGRTFELLFQNDFSDRVDAWSMLKTSPMRRLSQWQLVTPILSGWKVRAVEDYDGDGQRDLLVQRDSDGNVRFLLLNDRMGHVKRDTDITLHVGTGYKVAHNFNRNF